MKLLDGLWWPDADRRGRPAIVSQCAEAVPLVTSMLKERRVAVQAGGNVGVYPLALAKLFERVVTFEPDAENLECLRKNVAIGNVMVFHAALSSKSGTCAIHAVEPDNCGAHKVVPGDDVPVMTIDDLGLDACDLIWLDIEGHEAEAINGARETIAMFSPMIVLEEKGLGELADLPGYRGLGRIGNDTIYGR